MMKSAVLCLLLAIGAVNADVYMHSPRGSNNRLDEDTRERTNADRLFNSQNNDRGGSNVGATQGEAFYEGSVLALEWTNQHSCGHSTEAGAPNNDCNVIWQFMCHSRLRDGTTTDTIPVDNNDCANPDQGCDLDGQYGRHEAQAYYNMCSMTQRNLNLYTGGQDVLGDPGTGPDAPNGIAGAGAIATRQNPGGNRRGYECDEERDYYPYWRDSPWVDIVIFTNTPERCEAYMTESQNVKGRGACDVGQANLDAKVATVGWIPNNPTDCAAMGYTWNDAMYPAHGFDAPACVESMPQRDNHNGNTDGTAAGNIGGFNSVYNWTIPAIDQVGNCAVRVRYNISSADNGGHQKDLLSDPLYGSYGFASLNSIGPAMDYTANQLPLNSADNANSGDADKLDVWSQFNLDAASAAQGNRDYTMRDDPTVKIFVEAAIDGNPQFQIAIQTDQFFRTFEDRSHAIQLGVPRTDKNGLSPKSAGTFNNVAADAVIYNVNVRGKRGNNQQTYPGLEYDMVPNRLEVMVGDYIHYQWTGSDNNPANNNGEGNQGQDRTNVIQLADRVNFDEPGLAENKANSPGFPTHGAWGRNLPVDNIAVNPFLGWDAQVLDDMACLGINQAHVSIAPQMVGQGAVGTWNYYSTRNNNFTNRNHKAQVVVRAVKEAAASMGYAGGHVFAGPSYLKVHAGTLSKQHKVTFTSGPAANEWESNWVNVEVYAQGNSAHAFHVKEGKENTIDLQMAYTPSPFTKPTLYKTVDGVTSAHPAEFNHARGIMLAKVNNGGMHVVKYHINMPLVAGVGAATLFMLSAIVAGTVASCRKASKSA